MSRGRLVLVDSSPLIGLAYINGLSWLHHLFGEVYIPLSVKNEVISGKNKKGEAVIQDAIEVGWLKIWPNEIRDTLKVDLDQGEKDCINIGIHHKQPTLLVMDERLGRAVAKECQLRVTGTAAIIGMAKKKALINSARDVFEQLLQSDFRISPEIIREILHQVDEA